MKEIIAIIRTDLMEPTKGALESIGVKGIRFSHVSIIQAAGPLRPHT